MQLLSHGGEPRRARASCASCCRQRKIAPWCLAGCDPSAAVPRQSIRRHHAFDSAKVIVPAVLEEIAALRHRTEEVIGLTTGIPSLDSTTTGIRPDEYWVCGALPSRG